MALLNFPRAVNSAILSPLDILKIPVEFSRYTASASPSRADLGRVIRMDSASSMTVTLNANGTDGGTNFAVGEALVFSQWNTGTVTFAAGAGASLLSFNSLVAVEGRYAIAAAVYTDGNAWWLVGRLA